MFCTYTMLIMVMKLQSSSKLAYCYVLCVMICFYYIGRCNGLTEETGSCCWPFYNAHSPHFTLLFTSEPWCTPLMFAYVSLFHGRHSWLGLPCHVRLSSACVLYSLTASLQVASSCLFQHGHHRHKLTSVQVEV